jgi:hypothetical protein
MFELPSFFFEILSQFTEKNIFIAVFIFFFCRFDFEKHYFIFIFQVNFENLFTL